MHYVLDYRENTSLNLCFVTVKLERKKSLNIPLMKEKLKTVQNNSQNKLKEILQPLLTFLFLFCHPPNTCWIKAKA